jgi:hypothetical protein
VRKRLENAPPKQEKKAGEERRGRSEGKEILKPNSFRFVYNFDKRKFKIIIDLPIL